MPLGNYKRTINDFEPLIIPMDSLNKTTTPQIAPQGTQTPFEWNREQTSRLGQYEVPFLPKTSALRYLPGQLAEQSAKLIIPQSEAEAALQFAPLGMVAKPLAKTPIGKKAIEIGTKKVSEVAPSIFKGIANLSTKLLEKFSGMPNEITQQQFNEVVNKATKEGIRKVDLDLIMGLAQKQLNNKQFLNGTNFVKNTEIKSSKDIIPYFQQLFENKYGLKSPKITTVKDGIYIYGGETEGTGKIFIGLDDFKENPNFYDTYLEDAHDKIIQVMENRLSSSALRVSNKINLKKLASDVEQQLVPLKATPVKSPRWSYVGQDFIGDGKYGEVVYQSPIKTSAGQIHFPEKEAYEFHTGKDLSDRFPNYFSHIRYEDVADGKTRKILETQSDLMQKEGFPSNIQSMKQYDSLGSTPANAKDMTSKEWSILEKQRAKSSELAIKETRLLEPYSSNDPLAQLRTFREEVKRAAKDGKDTLLIPSGETAMKIEGLGESNNWFKYSGGEARIQNRIRPENMKVGMEVFQGGQPNSWIITDILGDGKFKAVPLDIAKKQKSHLLESDKETFDISGKVDTQHFVFKLNEEAIPKEARKMGLNVEGKFYVDERGNLMRGGDSTGYNGDWWKIQIPPERAKMPVEAYGLIGVPLLDKYRKENEPKRP